MEIDNGAPANEERCPECGTVWSDARTCQDHFYQMLAWEFEHNLLDVHHLMVLSYHLQHPSLYSPDGLEFGERLLVDFLVRGTTPDDVRKQHRSDLDSGVRKFKIKGRPASHGVYKHPVEWKMTAADVVNGGVDNYYENVRAWSHQILETLQTSGNLPPGSLE